HPRRASPRRRRASRKRLDAPVDHGLEVARGAPVARAVEEELAVALWAPERRGGDAEHVPAAQHRVSGEAGDRLTVERRVAHDAALQQAFGETARGGAHVEADAAGHLHLEGVERVGELLAAPAHERRTPLDLDARFPGDEGARLVDALAVHEHLTRQDEADGLLPALDEPALDEHTVDTDARYGLGHALHYRRPPRRDRI